MQNIDNKDIREFKIIKNAIQTPDGTILVSETRHDYKQYTDKNGKVYIVDGGKDYLRRAGDDYIELSITSDDTIEVIRENLTWGTYGKEGKLKYKQKYLKELSNSHIENIIKDGYSIKDIMQRELDYRNSIGLLILD